MKKYSLIIVLIVIVIIMILLYFIPIKKYEYGMPSSPVSTDFIMHERGYNIYGIELYNRKK